MAVRAGEGAESFSIIAYGVVRLPLLQGDSVFLAADRTNFYYTDVPINAHAVKLETAPVSRECRS